MARELYRSLLTQVASEHFYFWLNSLKEFSMAEQCLTQLQEDDIGSALSSIADSLKSYHKGIASLTVSTSDHYCVIVQIFYSFFIPDSICDMLPAGCQYTHEPSKLPV